MAVGSRTASGGKLLRCWMRGTLLPSLCRRRGRILFVAALQLGLQHVGFIALPAGEQVFPPVGFRFALA